MKHFRVGSFSLVEKIASGGMGDIWRGFHVEQDIPVVVKVLRGGGVGGVGFNRDFRREVRAVARLDHPAIVTLFDIGDVTPESDAASDGAVEAGSPYLVMEYFRRGSLDSWVFPLPWQQAKRMLLAVLDGLAHAHARGITHRDLKPGNILIADENSDCPVRLTDFGIAFSYEERRSAAAAGNVIGTPPYMAPEQFMGEWRDFGPWTDLYALGCVAYEMSSGRLPFEHRDVMQLATAHIQHEPPALNMPSDYPRAFEGWVKKLLEKTTRRRYRWCVDAAVDLVSVDAMGSTTVNPDVKTYSFAFADDGSLAGRAASEVSLPRRPFKLVGAGPRLFSFKTVPIIGRDRERDIIWGQFEIVSEQKVPRVVILEGSAGSGKSRLAAWLYETTHAMGLADRLRVQHDRSRRREFGLSYMMASAWSCLGSTAAELQSRVAAVLTAAGIDSDVLQKAVTEFLAPAALGDAFSPGMFHEFRSREARFSVLFEIMRRVHVDRPVVVWLDDVHWATDALRFIDYVVARAPQEPMPMFAILTVRDDLLVDLRDAAALLRGLIRRENTHHVHVAPLSDTNIRLLVNNLLYLQGDLAERVSVRSGGNPLYATQLVEDWINRGVLQPGNSGFVLSGQGDAEIPDDVHAVWVRRLERVLDECTEGAVQSANQSVERIAMQVALELAAALGGIVRVDEWLSVCELAGVSDPTPVLEASLASRLARMDVDRWSFSHSMLSDTIERIARERRRWASHNRLCAEMLEKRRPVPHWGDSERIGRHRFDSTEFENALRPLMRGARERRRLEEYSAALWLLAMYDRALDALNKPDSEPRRLEAWLVQADIYATRRDSNEALEIARRVRTLAKTAETMRFDGLAVLIQARVHQHQGRLQMAFGEFEEAQRILRVTGPKHDLARCLSDEAHVMLKLDWLDEAWRAFNEAQEIFEDIGQLIPWAENQLGLAHVALRQGDRKRARAMCKRVRNFARREQLNRLTAAAWSVLAEIQVADGDYDDAEHSLDKSIELFDQLGLTRQAFHPRSLKALLWLEAGNINRATRWFEQMRDNPDIDTPRMSSLLTLCVGLAVVVDGAPLEFQGRFEEIAGRVQEIERPPPDVVRCLQLAAGRATKEGFPERAKQIEELVQLFASPVQQN